jgi:hypothetical protein
MNRELDNIDLFPYSFDPEYSVEKINSRQHLIAEASPKQPSLFSVQLQ